MPIPIRRRRSNPNNILVNPQFSSPRLRCAWRRRADRSYQKRVLQRGDQLTAAHFFELDDKGVPVKAR